MTDSEIRDLAELLTQDAGVLEATLELRTEHSAVSPAQRIVSGSVRMKRHLKKLAREIVREKVKVTIPEGYFRKRDVTSQEMYDNRAYFEIVDEEKS